jgi:hypothetical protein
MQDVRYTLYVLFVHMFCNAFSTYNVFQCKIWTNIKYKIQYIYQLRESVFLYNIKYTEVVYFPYWLSVEKCRIFRLWDKDFYPPSSPDAGVRPCVRPCVHPSVTLCEHDNSFNSSPISTKHNIWISFDILIRWACIWLVAFCERDRHTCERDNSVNRFGWNFTNSLLLPLSRSSSTTIDLQISGTIMIETGGYFSPTLWQF